MGDLNNQVNKLNLMDRCNPALAENTQSLQVNMDYLQKQAMQQATEEASTNPEKYQISHRPCSPTIKQLERIKKIILREEESLPEQEEQMGYEL